MAAGRDSVKGASDPGPVAPISGRAATDLENRAGSVECERVHEWSGLIPKRAYVLRSPSGQELLAVFGGPATESEGATFFAHAPGFDGELTLTPEDGWSVLRQHPEAEQAG